MISTIFIFNLFFDSKQLLSSYSWLELQLFRILKKKQFFKLKKSKKSNNTILWWKENFFFILLFLNSKQLFSSESSLKSQEFPR